MCRALIQSICGKAYVQLTDHLSKMFDILRQKIMCMCLLNESLCQLSWQSRPRPKMFLNHASLPCRYKHEIRKEDQEALRKLIKVQYHYQVSPEITRELDASRYAVSKPQPELT